MTKISFIDSVAIVTGGRGLRDAAMASQT